MAFAQWKKFLFGSSWHTVVAVTAILLLAMSGNHAPISQAASSPLQVGFNMTTAATAAVGAVMQYNLIVTNPTSGSLKETSTVTLTDPSSKVATLYTQTLSVGANSNRVKTQTFSTSTNFPGETGSFTLTATVKDGSNNVIYSQFFPLTVVAAPGNGVWGIAGGAGPATESIGTNFAYQAVTSNLTNSTMSLHTFVKLVNPDSTQATLYDSGLVSVAPGSALKALNVNTGQYNAQTGTFGLLETVLDGSNNLLSSQTTNFTRNPVPASFYSPTFTDMAAAAGINVANNVSNSPCVPGPGEVGAGGAAADYDGDGHTDVFLVDGVNESHLWHNNGNGTFTDMATAAGLPVIPGAVGALFFDYDNDGHPDLLVLVANSGGNRLFHNNGNGTFTDVSASSGIQTFPNRNWVSATAGDYDNDGFLDLFIGAEGDCNKMNSGDHLYHNNGNGTFTDTTNLLVPASGGGLGLFDLTVLFFDYNQDGFMDLYIGNVGGAQGPNYLYKNNGNGTFTDVSSSSKAGVNIVDMGIAIGNPSHSGMLDMYLGNVAASDYLRQNSDGTFTNIASPTGTGRATVPVPGGTTSSVVWSTCFCDFNNDGWQDIFAAGHSGTKQPIVNSFFLNYQNGKFLDLGLPAGIGGTGGSQTAIFGDFNEDGFLDVLVTNHGSTPQLFINNSKSLGNPYHYLRVKLVGTTSNHDGVGARLTASAGGISQVAQMVNGGNYQADNEPIIHFGLGASTTVDTLTINWPSGKVTTMTAVPADQVLTVTEP